MAPGEPAKDLLVCDQGTGLELADISGLRWDAKEAEQAKYLFAKYVSAATLNASDSIRRTSELVSHGAWITTIMADRRRRPKAVGDAKRVRMSSSVFDKELYRFRAS